MDIYRLSPFETRGMYDESYYCATTYCEYGPSSETVYDFRYDGHIEVKAKCQYCGQWSYTRSACPHCGAPIDD